MRLASARSIAGGSKSANALSLSRAAEDPLSIACAFYHFKPMAAFFNAFQLRAYRAAQLRLEPPVLDVGCSNGEFAVLLERTLRPIPLMVGVDLDARAVARAKQIAAHCYSDLHVGDAAQLPFADGSFRTVLCNASMVAFGTGVDRAIAEIHRVLEPGGRVYVTLATAEFERNYPFARLFRSMGLEALARFSTAATNRRLPHFYAYSAQQWRDLFSDCRFKVQRTLGFFPPSEVGYWGVLAWTPLRVHGLLRYVRSQTLRRAVAAFYRRRFAVRYQRTPIFEDADTSAYIFLEAVKPG